MQALTNQHNLEIGGYNILIYLPCLPCTTEVLKELCKIRLYFSGSYYFPYFKHASADAFQNPTTVFEGVIISCDLKQQVLIKLPPKEQKSSGLAVNWEETSVIYWINKKPFINSSEYQFMLGMHKMTGVGGAITNDVLNFRKVINLNIYILQLASLKCICHR